MVVGGVVTFRFVIASTESLMPTGLQYLRTKFYLSFYFAAIVLGSEIVR